MWKSKKRILKELTEAKPLPMGRKEFEIWSIRIINAAQIPGATVESLQFCLADMLMHIKPTCAFESDGYFVQCLRKFAVNQVADDVRREIRDKVKARLAEEEKLKGEVVPKTEQLNETKVLANQQV
jgi:hypothetical protein